MKEDMQIVVDYNPFATFFDWLLRRPKPAAPTIAELRQRWIDKTERDLADARFDAEFYVGRVAMLEQRRDRLLAESGLSKSYSAIAATPIVQRGLQAAK